MTNAHPHAENMRLYAEDAAETDKPWERWEFYSKANGCWEGVEKYPLWSPDLKYRRKPRTRSLNGHEYPEPEVDAPEVGVPYWLPAPTAASGMVIRYKWWGDEIDRRMLRRGEVHLTREAAEAHARAIILAGGGEV